jgi:hypothetical protein
MGQLFDLRQKIDEKIRAQGRNIFEVRGTIALKAGFVLASLREDSPDDSAKLEKLKQAAREVLGVEVTP